MHSAPKSPGQAITFRGKTFMATAREVAVTLAPELFAQLKAEAELLGLPMEWLVASLVADTLEERTLEPALV